MINETEALEIATQYLYEQYQASDVSIRVRDRQIELTEDDPGLVMMGLLGTFYTVTFHCHSQPHSFDPDYIILLVNAKTGEPLWYPGEH